LFRIAASGRFGTAPHQHVLIRHSAGGAAHYLTEARKLRTISMVPEKFIREEPLFGWASHVTQQLEEMMMNIRKLSIVLLAGIATLVTAIEPSLAAQRRHRAYDAYASGAVTDRSGAYYYGPRGTVRSEALTPAQHYYNRYNYGHNLPYPDRPYGDPDSW